MTILIAPGTYRLTRIRTGAAVVVSSGDQGGALTNGATGVVTGDGTLDVTSATSFANDGLFAPGASPGSGVSSTVGDTASKRVSSRSSRPRR